MNVNAKKALLKKQGYKLVLTNGAVKPCSWLRKSLFNKGYCYKQEFYGIKSHRCLQCTPSVHYCKHNCLFCWRPHETTIINGLNTIDDPKELVNGMLKAQKEFLSGYNKSGVDEKKLSEAQKPTQVAISLAGEPTEYKKLGELIKEFKKRGMTVFLVTNGTNPEALKDLSELPTQLYLTLPAPDEETYLMACAPLKNEWKKILKSLMIIKELKCRRVIRLTLIKDLNMKKPEEYANLIMMAKPDFIEPKSFMSVGFARKRLPYESMPYFNEIKEFSKELAKHTGYDLINEKADSRVCLLASKDAPNPII
jgi:tRNA wybutosine-synthesizing protein 1